MIFKMFVSQFAKILLELGKTFFGNIFFSVGRCFEFILDFGWLPRITIETTFLLLVNCPLIIVREYNGI